MHPHGLRDNSQFSAPKPHPWRSRIDGNIPRAQLGPAPWIPPPVASPTRSHPRPAVTAPPGSDGSATSGDLSEISDSCRSCQGPPTAPGAGMRNCRVWTLCPCLGAPQQVTDRDVTCPGIYEQRWHQILEWLEKTLNSSHSITWPWIGTPSIDQVAPSSKSNLALE